MDDLKAARTTSDGIPDSQARIQAYLHLATTLAQRGQVQESLSTVAAAVDLGKSTGKRAYDDVASVGYGHVAAALAAGGHLKEARAAMEHVDKGAFRIGMTMLVRAAEIALSGDDIAAMAAKEKLDLGGCREALAGAARTKALAGDMKDARRIIGAIPSGGQRVVALVSIAIAQRQAGDAKAALATLAEAEKMCDVAADELANPPAEETPVAPASKATTNMWAGGGGGVVRASATTLADWAGACAALADAYAQAGELAAARNRLDACLEVAEQHASRTSGPSAAEMLRPTTIRVLIARGELGSAVRAASDPKQGVYPTMCATIARAYVAKGDTDGLEKFIKSLHTPQQRVLAYVGASMAKPAK